MSKYTTQLRWIIEEKTSNSTKGIRERIIESCPLIFNFYYPFWDENKRLGFETMILKHFFTKEIGFETYALWQLSLDDTLNIIMPYYNQLYKSASNDIDYFIDTDITDTFTGNKEIDELAKIILNGTSVQAINGRNTGDNTATTNTTINDAGQSKSLNSDFPQATLNNMDYGSGSIETEGSNTSTTNTRNEDKINETNIQNTDSEIEQTTDDKKNTKEKNIYTLNKKGHSQNLSDLLNSYRSTIINIDKMVLSELGDLFIKIY